MSDFSLPPEDSDDLFTPSLDPVDDRHGFHNPFNPHHLLWVAAFGGVLPAGILVMVNDHRLGVKSRVRWVLPLLLVVFGLAVLGSLSVMGSEGGAMDMTRNFRMFNRVVALVFTWLLLAPQRHRFAIFETGDDKPASLWGPAIGLMVVTYGVVIAVFSILVSIQ